MKREDGTGSGLLASLRRFALTMNDIVRTRLELFATEFDDERQRIGRALWLAGVSAFCLSLGVLLAVLFVVIMFWDTHRLLLLGLLAAGFLGAGLAAVLVLRAQLTNRGALFALTLAELRRDRQHLEA
jgi:uncharacterized membrane protein YqjE